MTKEQVAVEVLRQLGLVASVLTDEQIVKCNEMLDTVVIKREKPYGEESSYVKTSVKFTKDFEKQIKTGIDV